MDRDQLLRWRSQQGNALMFVVLGLTVAVGGYLTLTNNRNVTELKRVQNIQGSEAARLVNTNNLKILASLLSFPGNLPPAQQTADNPAYLPVAYPDPYLNPSGGPVKLIVLKQPPADARYAQNGSGIRLTGFDPTTLSKADMTSIYAGQGHITGGVAAALPSQISLTATTVVPASTTLATMTIESLTTLSKQTGQARSNLKAVVKVPVPPAPVVVASSYPAAAVPLNSTFQIKLQGFGLMQAGKIYSADGQSFSLAIPTAEAYSITNTFKGGFNLGTYTFKATEVNGQANPVSPTLSYFYVYVSTVGPGGTTTTGPIQVPVIPPPTCAFTQIAYAGMAGSFIPVAMKTSGVVSTAAIYDPYMGLWRSGTTAALPSTPGKATQFINSPGSVSGPGGTGSCTYTVVGSLQAIVPSTQTCWDDVLLVPMPLGVWYFELSSIWAIWDSRDAVHCYGRQCNSIDGSACATVPKPRVDGCFSADTQLLLATGERRRIDRLQPTDRVFNPLTGRSALVKRLVKGLEAEPLLQLGYAGASVKVTSKHPFLTLAGPRPARELARGEHLIGSDGLSHPIETLVRLPAAAGTQVYNVELESGIDDEQEHWLVADGILTGDLKLQERLGRGAYNEHPVGPQP